MVADSICGSLCIKMHDPKTQGSKTDASEASIHPVSAVLHIVSEGVKSNQYLIEHTKNEWKDNEKFLFNQNHKKTNYKENKKTNKPKIFDKIRGHWTLWISLFYKLGLG